jgi:rare lipoprotein A
MTAAELASIPDPVPPDSPATTEGSAGATDDSRPTTEGSAAGEWRVQIYASPDLAQADRVAKEGSVKLGVAYVIEFEGSLYKVRLGAFSSESEAQALRERAVGEGFPGAFRVWVRPGANDSFK